MSATSNQLEHVFNAILSISFLIMALFLTIFHIWSVVQHTGGLCMRPFLKEQPTIFIVYGLLFISVLSGVSLTLDSVILSDLCAAAQYYGLTLYSIFKTMLYVILGVRIWTIFRDTQYQYNNKGLATWNLLIILWTLFNITVGLITVESSIETEEGGVTKCLVAPSMIYIASQALLDITACVVNTILFVRPICKLYKMSQKDLRFKIVAIKQMILSVIAVSSSIIFMFGIAAVPNLVPTWVSLDMCLSTICVVLMYKWNDAFTTKVFFCCMPQSDVVGDVENVGQENVGSEEKTNQSVNSSDNPRSGAVGVASKTVPQPVEASAVTTTVAPNAAEISKVDP